MVVVGRTRAGSELCIPDEYLDRHTLTFGQSGMGKTLFNFVLIGEILKRGDSLVVIDPDQQTAHRLRGACAAAGVKPEHVVTIDPTDREAIPAFNPFRSGDAPERMVSQLLSIIDLSMDTGGSPQARSFLLHALTIAAWHGATLLDVPKLLRDEAHRKQILRSPLLFPRDDQYDYSAAYLEQQFSKVPPASLNSSLTSIDIRFHEIIGTHFFSRLFGRRESCVTLPDLFTKQRVVLAILNPKQIGNSRVQFLGGMLAHLTLAAATSHGGPRATRSVVLCLDEMGSQSKFLSDALEDVANMARKYRLRLVVSTQHPGKLPPTFRADIRTSSKVKVFFGTTGDAAEPTAKFLESYTEGEEADEFEGEEIRPYVGKLLAGRIREYGLFPVEANWDPPTNPLYVDPGYPGDTIKQFCSFSETVDPPLYLADGRRLLDVLYGLPQGWAYLQWRGRQGYVVIDPPKALPPPPKPNWLQILGRFQPGQAVMMIGEAPPEVVEITRVNPPPDAPAWYVARSRTACREREVPRAQEPEPVRKEEPDAGWFTP